MKTLDIKIKNKDGVEVKVQIQDYLSSEDYYTYLILAPKEENLKPKDITPEITKAQQAAEYHLILSTVINPKLTEDILRKMNFLTVSKMGALIAKEVFPSKEELDSGETDFLEQEGPQEDLQQGVKEV